MKKFIYFLAALMALTVTSCNDDDTTFNINEDLDRLPMPMFRRKYNTNVDNESDLFASRLVSGYRNRIQLHWYGVEGASGYEIRYQESGNARAEEEQWIGPHVTYVKVGPDQLSYDISDLNYDSHYVFCIRALSPLGEEHNSKWYGMGDGNHNTDYVIIDTDPRYATPNITDWRDKTYDGFTVMIDPTYDRSAYSRQDADTIESRFNIVNGKLQFTHLVIQAHSSNPDAVVNPEFVDHKLTPEELSADGDGIIRVNVTGLSSSALYVVALRDDNNTKATSAVDRLYNAFTVRTRGDAGPDILVPHKVASEIWVDPAASEVDMGVEKLWFDAERKYQACRLDTVLSKFNKDFTLAEGQTFLLEGGKAYYLRVGPNLCKGFTLRTDPASLAEHGRAKVYLGGLYRDPGTGACIGACNMQLGKEKESGEFDAPINVEKVIFADIDFDCPESVNHGENLTTKVGTTDNYFVNMLSKGLPVTYESFEMRNCTFQHVHRGFFRIQGSSKRYIDHLVMDNCMLLNCGFRSDKGIDYNLIHGENQNVEENVCNLLEVTNNTFYDTPIGTITPIKSGKFTEVADNVHWNIRVENNTFINFCTRSDQALLNIRDVPGDSKITFKNNLIVLARDAADKRRLGFCGIDVRTIHGSGNVEFDIRDNYSAGCEDAHLVDDGIVTNASTRFSATKNAPGYWPDCLGANTIEDLKIHVGSTPLRATDVFMDPNPTYHATSASEAVKDMHYADPDKIWDRLTYKSDAKLLNHEIYTKNIGAQRWKSGDPKNFRIDF